MKKIKIVFAVFLSIMILGSALVFGATITKTIQAAYRNISIQVNGKEVVSEQEPFIYQGRTFVPLRTIGEVVNKTVEWDNAKNQIKISDPVSSVTRLSSYYELLNYFPDHYKYSKSDIKPTPTELSKIEEFWKYINPNFKWDLEKNPILSYFVKSSTEDLYAFYVNGVTAIRYSNGVLYFCLGYQSKISICSSSDGWISKRSWSDSQIEEERYYLNYLKQINLSILNDTPNRTKQITDLFAIPLWIYSLE
jgi:hypothetical protein